MIEKEIVEPGVRQMYDRKKEEVRASHILLKLAPNASAQDTFKTYERAMSIIAQIPQVSFDTLAIKNSEDPSAKDDHGDIGFFSGGRMVPEFEDACYSLNVGEYTKAPIRSQFGYHIIKVTARQLNPGTGHIHIIFLRDKPGSADTASVRDTVWMIYNKIKTGTSFVDMVKKYSQEPKSAAHNGDIGSYELDRIPQKIADAFYKLKNDSIAEPVLFNNGFYICEFTDRKALPSFADMQKDLKEIYQKDRYQRDYKKYVDGLIIKYDVHIDSSAAHKLISSLDTTKISGNEVWKDTLSAKILNMSLIHSLGLPFTVNNFADKVLTTNDLKTYILTPNNIWLLIHKMLDVAALEDHARNATERYPVLANLLKEYEEGILLYRIEQDEVWKKVMINDSLLKEYYSAHKEEYRWPERINFAEIFSLSDSMAKAAYWKVRYGEDFLDVAQEYTNRSGYKEKKGVWGLQPLDFNDLSRKASTMVVDSVSEPFKFEAGWSIIKTLGKDSAHVKNFEDATPEVASGYQEAATKQIEKDWVEALKRKYPITINTEVLIEAFKRKRVESQ